MENTNNEVRLDMSKHILNSSEYTAVEISDTAPSFLDCQNVASDSCVSHLSEMRAMRNFGQLPNEEKDKIICASMNVDYTGNIRGQEMLYTKEEYQMLNQDNFMGNLQLVRGNQKRQVLSPFCNCRITNGKIIKMNESDATYFVVYVSIEGKNEEILLEENFTPKEAVKSFRNAGVSFLTNLNDSRAGELLASYLSFVKGRSDTEFANSLPGWTNNSTGKKFMYAENSFVFKGNKSLLDNKIGTNFEKKSDLVSYIIEYHQLCSIINNPQKSLVIMLFMHYGLFSSLLSEKNIVMRKFFLIEGVDLKVRCETLLKSFFQIYNKEIDSLIDLEVPTSDLLKTISQKKDEIVLISADSSFDDCYERDRRKKNMKTTIKACFDGINVKGSEKKMKLNAPLVFACNGIPLDIPYDDALVMCLENDEINWDLYSTMKEKPYIIGNYLVTLFEFLENNFCVVEEAIRNGKEKFMKRALNKCATNTWGYIIFKIIIEILNKFFLLSGAYTIKEVLEKESEMDFYIIKFFSECEENSDFSDLSMIFVEGLKELKSKKKISFHDRLTGKVKKSENEKFVLYYDDKNIYFTQDTFKNQIIPSIIDCKIVANQFLLSMEQDDLISMDQTSKKTFTKKIMIKRNDESRVRMRLIAVKRESFEDLGKPDLVEGD